MISSNGLDTIVSWMTASGIDPWVERNLSARSSWTKSEGNEAQQLCGFITRTIDHCSDAKSIAHDAL